MDGSKMEKAQILLPLKILHNILILREVLNLRVQDILQHLNL